MSDMECGRLQDLLSAVADGEIGADEREPLIEHCRSCPECASFEAGLRRLALIPAPSAPQGLAKRVLVAVEEERQADLVAIPTAIEGAIPKRHERERTILIATAAVAALFVATGVGFAVLDRFGGRTAQKGEMMAETEGEGGAGTAPGEREGGPFIGTTQTARFVSRGGVVSASSGAPQSLPAGAVATSSVISAMDTTGQPVSRRTFETTSQPGVLFVEHSDGTFEPFTPQTRSLGGITYVLVTGTPVTLFGQWPSLPGRFAEPQRPDGWPTFAATGQNDSSGAEVYSASGSSPDSGFALPPETASGPASGAPVWTWWERRR